MEEESVEVKERINNTNCIYIKKNDYFFGGVNRVSNLFMILYQFVRFE